MFQLRYISSALTSLRNKNIQLRNEIERLKTTTKVQLRMVNSSIKRLIPTAIFQSCGQRTVDAANVDEGNEGSGEGNGNSVQQTTTNVIPFTSSLVKNPRTLNVL